MRSRAMQKVRGVFAALGGLALLQSGAQADQSRKSFRPRAAGTEARTCDARITAEASTVHVIACDGPGENGDELYVYEDTSRSAFRVGRPGWGGAGGGRDFSTLEDAIRIACTAERIETTSPARVRVR